MKVGFTGTQKGMTPNQRAMLTTLLLKGVEEIHLGDCIGADAEAWRVATLLALHRVGHPPQREYKRAFLQYDEERPGRAYLIRNRQIVEESDFLIAAPRTNVEEVRSGTWSTVRYARKLGKSVIILTP